MLRITIELIPGGRERDAEIIGRGYIANISNLHALSDYDLRFEERSWRNAIRGPYAGTLSKFSKWPRNERGAWEIVRAALNIVIDEQRSPKSKTRKTKA
jgi:hypothetical protein